MRRRIEPSPTNQPLVPSPLTVADAIRASPSWQQLAQRLQAAQQRLAIVRAVLPPPLQASVQSGTLDAESWHLLVPSAALSAKLRHWLPRMQEALDEAGLPRVDIQVRIMNPPEHRP